ncbi:MAG: biopolymer transporter ExbD [Spirochaetia bacterium]|nr:biopolymer transporter ExbD [Spirochaetia bacterium]
MRIARRRSRFISMPMNAMCDIAFLLFIFIMVVSSANVRMPEDFRLAESDGAESLKTDMEIFVSENGGLFLDGEAVSPEALSAAVSGHMTVCDDMHVGVAAHKNCEFRKVHEVIAMLEELNCQYVVLILKKN